MINKHQARVLRSPSYTESINFRATYKKKEVEFTYLIAILFCIHLRVNVAAILVIFIPGPLSYFK